MNGLLLESNLFIEYEWSVDWIQFTNVYRIWMVCCLDESNLFIEYEWSVVWIQFVYRIWMVCCLNPICLWYMNESNWMVCCLNPICLWNMNGLLFESNLFIEYEWFVVRNQFLKRSWMVCYLDPICSWNMNGCCLNPICL